MSSRLFHDPPPSELRGHGAALAGALHGALAKQALGVCSTEGIHLTQTLSSVINHLILRPVYGITASASSFIFAHVRSTWPLCAVLGHDAESVTQFSFLFFARSLCFALAKRPIRTAGRKVLLPLETSI